MTVNDTHDCPQGSQFKAVEDREGVGDGAESY